MTSKQRLLWKTVLKSIKDNITKDQFRTWFSKLNVISFSEKNIKIVVPNIFVKECLSNNYKELITEKIYDICKFKANLIFLTKKNIKLNEKRESNKKKYKKQISDINSNYTFEKFVVGSCNRLAHAAAKSIIESPGYIYNPLFIYGPTGLGKTHLLQSIYLTLIKNNESDSVMYITCYDLINELILYSKKGKVEQFRKKYREFDFLLIDDIHFLSNSNILKDEFFNIFNSLYNTQKQIVLSSNCLPEDITSIEKRLISRFNWGLKCKLESPEIETSIAIIEEKYISLGIKLPLDVIKFLAKNITSNIREIESAIFKIKEKAALHKCAINLDLTKSILYENISKKKIIGVEMILKVIANQYDINITKLLSRNRLKSITLPRQMAMYLTRKLTDLSYNEIGGYFGGRDHTTVMYAYQKIKTSISNNNEIKNVLQEIENKLGRY